jgi:hypothetical protein
MLEAVLPTIPRPSAREVKIMREAVHALTQKLYRERLGTEPEPWSKNDDLALDRYLAVSKFKLHRPERSRPSCPACAGGLALSPQPADHALPRPTSVVRPEVMYRTQHRLRWRATDLPGFPVQQPFQARRAKRRTGSQSAPGIHIVFRHVSFFCIASRVSWHR